MVKHIFSPILYTAFIFLKFDSTIDHQAGTESIVNIFVYGKDTTEHNALMIDFNQQYNTYFSKASEQYLSPTKINMLLDTFCFLYFKSLDYNAVGQR